MKKDWIETDHFLARLFHGIGREYLLMAGISLGVFLFVLFFQPFPYDPFDFTDRVLFIAGLGLIVFITLVCAGWILIGFYGRREGNPESKQAPPYLFGLVFWVLNSVAYAFYLKYVGSIGISFHIMVQVAFISMIPPLVLSINDVFLDLTRQNEQLIRENLKLKQDIFSYSENKPARTVTFVSESRTSNINFPIDDILMFRSADNYVQVLYRDQKKTKKRMLRNTLKNIEQQLEPYPDLIRCHRTCIVNLHYAVSLNRKNNSYWLMIKDHEDPIPVSRQYLIPTRKALAQIWDG